MTDEEDALDAARERVARAMQHPVSNDELRASWEAESLAEFNLALAKGQECARVIDWPAWDIGAPLPHVVATEGKAFLLYLMGQSDPEWDGTYATMKSPTSTTEEKIAIVTFDRVASFRMGSPNDEVLHGHPLHGRGLTAYRAHVVENSTWLQHLKDVNRVHSGYAESSWSEQRHYLLAFHDSVFECIARRYAVEVVSSSLPATLADLARRVVL